MNAGKRVSGMSDIKTRPTLRVGSPKAKIRSMPGGASKERCRDLYIMSQERGRLVREMAALARRKRNLESELKDIEKEMHSAGRRVFERKKGAGKSKEGEAFRIVAIEY